MLRVGLTGGLATGKSFVGHALVARGCHLLKADDLGHRALEPGGGAFVAAVEAFGSGILDVSGRIDRRRLGAQVFSDPDKLALLNSFVHPVVIAREAEWMRGVAASEPGAIAVVEAAILIETGSYVRFDRLVLTVCRRDQQIERALKRDGLSLEEVERRLDRQMPLDEKRKFAHYVVDTSGEKEATLRQVDQLYDALRSINQ